MYMCQAVKKNQPLYHSKEFNFVYFLLFVHVHLFSFGCAAKQTELPEKNLSMLKNK